MGNLKRAHNAKICDECENVIYPNERYYNLPPNRHFHEKCMMKRKNTTAGETLINELLDNGPRFQDELPRMAPTTYRTMRLKGFPIFILRNKGPEEKNIITIYYLLQDKEKMIERIKERFKISNNPQNRTEPKVLRRARKQEAPSTKYERVKHAQEIIDTRVCVSKKCETRFENRCYSAKKCTNKKSKKEEIQCSKN